MPLHRLPRRNVLTLLGGAAAATWPLVARAQSGSLPVVGMLNSASRTGPWLPLQTAFRQGLSERGYTEGQNVRIESRWAEDQYDRLPALAADLIQHGVAVIVAFTTPSVRAAQAATTITPIVFTTISDPVQVGFVASLSRPGGNLTGVSLLSVEVGPKLLELLHAAVPSARSVALLINPTNPNAEVQSTSLKTAAERLGVQLHTVNASTLADLDPAFARVRELNCGALMIAQDVFFNTETARLAALALRHAIPAVYPYRDFAEAGGLMSYGADFRDAYRQAGIYTGRVLKGEKPADLPVLQATKIHMIVNLKTAKAIGLTLSPDMVSIADEVIE